MESIYTAIDYIENSLLIVYLLSFGIAVHRFRIINSTVICVGLLFIMEAIMNWLKAPLLEFNSREVWYGTWIFLYIATIVLLYKIHHVLKVNIISLTNTIAYTCLISAAIHAARYIEREHFGGEYLDTWYYLAVNTINISLALIILMTVVRHKKEKLVGLYV